ncbi:MAG TPA: VOC family protein [Acidimicrobiales bacterium]|nr:VOC family protein [Acidimicrobiales bacterium]
MRAVDPAASDAALSTPTILADRSPFDSYGAQMRPEKPAFKMGRLDHVHIRVPDRAEAARWYAAHLGFEPVESYEFWATGFEGGPLQIPADGGRTMLALFEASESHPMVPQETGVAFSVDADSFVSFARSLPCGIDNPGGEPLTVADLVDFDMCWAFDLNDPWGNKYELNCYDYDRVRTELVEADAVKPVRYWPRQVYETYLDSTSS